MLFNFKYTSLKNSFKLKIKQNSYNYNEFLFYFSYIYIKKESKKNEGLIDF